MAGELGTGSALIGRDAEEGLLRTWVDQLCTRTVDVRIVGEPGIGKTSKLARATEHGASLGYEVLAAEGVPAETEFAFAGLHRLLLSRPDALGELQEMLTFHRAGTDGTDAVTLPLAMALLGLLRSMACERPLLMVVDDLQWIDPASSQLLDFFSRRVRQEPIGMIGTAEQHNRSTSSTAQVLELEPLSAVDAKRLLENRYPDLTVALRRRILLEARGNPLVLSELTMALHRRRDTGSTAVRWFLPVTDRLEAAFAPQLRTYPVGTRAVLLAASVDESAELTTVLAVARDLLGGTVGAEALDTAVADDLITPTPGHATLTHPVLASIIAAAEPEHWVRAAHLSLAARRADSPVAQALHRACATVGYDDDLAAALDGWTPVNSPKGTAIGFAAVLARAAELTTDRAGTGARLVAATQAAYEQGDHQAFNELARRARLHPLTSLDEHRLDWVTGLLEGGEPVRAPMIIERCARARAAYRSGDTKLALDLLHTAALDCWWGGMPAVTREAVIHEAGRLGLPETDARLINILSLVTPPEAGRHLIDLIERARQSTSSYQSQSLLGVAAHAAGDPVSALELIGHADRPLREVGLLGRLAHLQSIQLSSHLAVGDLPAARTVSDSVSLLAGGSARPVWADHILAGTAVLAALSGDHIVALRLAAEAEMAARGARSQDLRTRARIARGLAWLAAGEASEAFRILGSLLRSDDPAHHPGEAFAVVSYVAEAAWRSGNAAQARILIPPLEQLAIESGSPMLTISLPYARAVLSAEHDFERLIGAAIDQDLTKWPLLRARTLLAQGSWLRRQRRVSESRGPLRLARSLFDVLGADAWHHIALGELRASGEREEHEHSSGARALLSAQEMQIAALAGHGLSNREIGQQLHLSPRTIGSHLYRIFPKLDITSRAQLAERLHAKP